ncbi:adenylyl-sulfate kinase [Amycolatopsis anabasis]|uniref:adenylyl-sulfate kinase n=1 Tax=Amycolatopsis anabasis TaxID=1840409 RepID=UPI00131E0E03|nr:adenylyl-sulfate kinase [Amycolatopsis anabasis]
MSTTLWLTGLPSSGKTTLARALTDRQRPIRAVEHLDGDAVRKNLFPELGYDRADRMENIRRIGELALMLAAHGVLAVVSVIAPYRHARDQVRAAHEARGLTFVEVHVDAPLAVCAARDVKGLYALAERGQISGLTGVGDVYETPVAPDLRVDTAKQGVDECVRCIERTLAHLEHGSGVHA